MLREDRTSPKSVALKSTIPSLVRGMFMVTRRCRKKVEQHKDVTKTSSAKQKCSEVISNEFRIKFNCVRELTTRYVHSIALTNPLNFSEWIGAVSSKWAEH